MSSKLCKKTSRRKKVVLNHLAQPHRKQKTQKFTFSDDDFLFENQPSQEVVTLQPIDDSFDEYEQNLGKNQVPDEDENQQDYRLTTL